MLIVFCSLAGCELKAEKEYQFKVDDEENEHQLSLRTVSSVCFHHCESRGGVLE